ncbi:hypothetical protein J1N35_041819 [Gossypium stocksii]|uniref:RNase H type-1 domain-containing protein n=1 Tax=Gossypium stocksii TaxID=47602 RepID=A0A9D3ZJS3_9ROSI|nr:hypothetical protein J1N35_041819 [Gossypium stocksii]
MGFQKVNDLRSYLGVPLFYGRVIKGTLRFVVEKMCSAFYAELWGIFDGLIILQDQGLNSILIHTDSLEVVHVLQRCNTTSSSSAMVRRIQQKLRNFEHWEIRRVQREANVVVDRIAKRVFAKREGVNVLTFAPTNLLVFLKSDKANASFDCISVV